MNISPAFIALLPGAYLLGSIPFGFIIAKLVCGRDPRTEGSGNVGATNVARLCGLPWGVLTLLCDAMKGLLPTWYALCLTGDARLAGIVGFCALIGHMYSIFLRFRGGKAVATTIGMFIPLSLPALALAAALCLAVIGLTRYVSLGSLTLAAALPISLALFWRLELVPIALVVMLVIFFKHRENIRRLLRKEEKKFGHRD